MTFTLGFVVGVIVGVLAFIGAVNALAWRDMQMWKRMAEKTEPTGGTTR